MTKNETIFVCKECGNESAKWSGKCLACGSWNSLKEMKLNPNTKNTGKILQLTEIVNLNNVKMQNFSKISTSIKEVDRVLGGGIVPGAIILLGGDPGIGKSTLSLQLANMVQNTLYVSGEESAEQIKLRADRLGIKSKNLSLLTATDVNQICEKLSVISSQLSIVIIDSIQTMYDSNFPSTPGSLVQVRECALKFQQLAKAKHIPIILIGHVTKDGNVAGPKTLEHLVDVVLYLEGERYQGTRILRGIKNRFGATDEIGVFEMGQNGLEEQLNPSKLFLSERAENIAGSVVTATIEGSRPFLVEIQALATPTVFGYPKRTASGFDLNRLNLLLAVLTKRTGLKLSTQDVYVNVAGGFKLKDPALDLAVCLAIASAYKNKPLDSKICLFGEIGLSGEIRAVTHEKKRKEEANRLGFKTTKKYKYIYEIVKDML